MSYKDDSKLWLQTDDVPTQEQFADICDWLRWKDELILYGDLHPLLQSLITTNGNRMERLVFTGDTTIVMPTESRLVHVAVKNRCGSALEFHINRIGDAPGVPWRIISVPANGKNEVSINETFWVDETMTLTEVSGVDIDAESEPILLIHRQL